ncbi:MAG: DUF1269 domain-containing protein [Candidatus Sericytochromatia bacterium]
MRHLLAIAYPTLSEAEAVRHQLVSLQEKYLLQLEDIVIAEPRANVDVKLHQAVNLPMAGAAQGSLLGLLVGVLFLNPLLGVAVGAASGAAAGALADIGINDDMMRELARTLPEEGVLLFVLAHDIVLDRVTEALRGAGGELIQTSLKHEDEVRLQRALEGVEAGLIS